MTLTRREALKSTGMAGAASLLARCGPTAPEHPRPNSLFVMTDDQTAQQMSC